MVDVKGKAYVRHDAPGNETRRFVGDGSDVKINWSQPEADRASLELFGKRLSGPQLARLASAPAGSTVHVDVIEARAASGQHDPVRPPTRIMLMVEANERQPVGATRWIEREGGVLVIHNAELYPRNVPGGAGAELLRRQVEEAVALGVDRIEARAAKGPTTNGYYTWARLGFNGDLPAKAKAAFPAAKDMNDLMVVGGKDWWKKNGETFEGTFDLKAGSRSRAILDEYVGALARGRSYETDQHRRRDRER